LISYRSHMTPLLPQMGDLLSKSLEMSNQGCFLYVSTKIVEEFSEGRNLDENIVEAAFSFFGRQATTTLRALSNIPASELPDVTEDFMHMAEVAVLCHPYRLVKSSLFAPLLEVATNSALLLEQRAPLSPTLRYLQYIIAFGGDNPPISNDHPNPPEVKEAVKRLLLSHGGDLVKRVIAGMMITFPGDCIADGSAVLLGLFRLLPEQTSQWLRATLLVLPAGTITEAEIDRLEGKINTALVGGAGGMSHVKSALRDFTTGYRRRFVAPRDGLGALEASRFRFSG
jgi:transportin-3